MKSPVTLEVAISHRADIDGLRAVAVVAVLAYHYEGGVFTGGFVGVDVFFVISGYLLSTIVVSEAQRGIFSFSRFYERRIRRIFPALFALLAICTVIAWLFVLPQDIISYSRSMLAASLSASNVYFWDASNYFDASAKESPLLHTWSLAVEEQFYILFPIFIVAVWHYMRRHLRTAVVLCAIISFSWSVIDLRIDQGAAFYLPLTRAWELLAGTVLALRILPIPRSRLWREGLAISGLLGIIILIFTLSVNTPFPGEYSLFPCAAAGAIILAGQNEKTLTGRVLSWRPVVFIGLISYSLYLWHWPLLVFSRIAIIPSLVHFRPIVIRITLAAISVAIATVSWRFVETPFRTGPRRPGKRAVYAFGAVCIIVFSASALVLSSARGLPGRFSADATAVADYLAYKRSHPADLMAVFRTGSCFLDRHEAVSDFNEQSCITSVHGKSEVLIFGDSHAANLQSGLEASVPNVHFNQAAASECPPTLQPAIPNDWCQQFVVKVLKEFIPKHSVRRVLLNADWRSWEIPNLTNTVGLLRQKGIGVVIFGLLPKYDKALPRLLAMSIESGHGDYAQEHRDRTSEGVDETMSRMAQEVWHVPYISLMGILCPHDRCVEYAAPHVPLQFDASHLTREGSEYLAREVNLRFPEIFHSKLP